MQTFGVNVKDTNLLAVVLSTNTLDSFNEVTKLIKGKETPLQDLEKLRNKDSLKRVYKISEEELKRSSLLESILGRMACKDFPVV